MSTACRRTEGLPEELAHHISDSTLYSLHMVTGNILVLTVSKYYKDFV